MKLWNGIALAGCVALALAPNLSAEDWARWRGPSNNGISTEKGWKSTWPADGPKIAWKAKVGLGYSSVVVGSGRAYTLGHADEKDTIFCFDAVTGKEVWKHSFEAELGDKYFDGGTTGTPTLAGDQLFVLNRWGDAFCLEAATGKVIWHRNVQESTGAQIPDWGFTGAPVIASGRVYLNVGEAGLALDAGTGAVVWKSSTKSAGYSTPFAVGTGERSVLIVGNSDAYVAIRPNDGKEAWRVKWTTQYGVNAADPILEGDRLFISSGYGKGSALFKLGTGEPEMLWKSKSLRSQMNAAVLFEGHLYGVDGDTSEKASLKCIDFATGKEKWNQAGFGSGGVIVADRQLIALNGTGELSIAPASPEGFKPTARAQVLGGKTWTAPVLSGGLIYCRNSRGDLVAVDVR